ncbi:outer membrane biogenesis protein BamB [Planctomycetes bacterium CA13]|uniref:Outer membrane biogenesis protein BamB n=2 Tax=Novipirellula herctigrandis TaxID=2527986 RepID=A0A5C5Z3T2_9BACT|nr:outer membrane biogenesis protein BamB [Planctomycetes bacterium CA13]
MLAGSFCSTLALVLITLPLMTFPSSAQAQSLPATGLPEVFADQWPSLRGPGGYGVGKPANTMTEWNVKTGEGILWSAKVPLPGNNSPIVWRDRIFMSGADETRQAVFCFDANTGKQLWIKDVETSVERPKVNEDAGLAAPTMASDGTRVFAIFATGDLVAFDFDGNLVWKKNLGLPNNPYGMGSSLISDGQRLFIQYDHRETQKVIALECHSGKPVWQKAREHISWSSPALIRAAKGLQLILNDEKNVTAYDPVTGKQLWQIECLGGEVAPSPAFNGKDILVVANEYAQATAIKLTGESPTIMWHYDDYLPEIASPLAAGGLVFIPTSYGDVACLDQTTGKELWVQHFDVDLRSSPIQVGDRVYLVDSQGVVHIFNVARNYREIATIEMGEPVDATPAFTGGRIYIRGEKTLYCIRNRKPSEDPFQQGTTAPGAMARKEQGVPSDDGDRVAENLPWLPMELHVLVPDLTVRQLKAIKSLESYRAMSAINDKITELGLVFWGAEGYAYRENKTSWGKHQHQFRKKLAGILTDKQKGRFDYEIDPEATAANWKPVKVVENRVAPGQQIDFEGTDWAQFMGPHRNGISDETGLLREWPENGPPVLWTVPVGGGFAGPVIVGDKVYLLDREKERDVFRCYDLKTGEELWNYGYLTEGKFMREGSRSVPTIDGDHAYICGGYGDLICLDLNTHEVVWSENFWNDYKVQSKPAWGLAQNPLIYGDLVIIAPQTAQVGVVARDKKTGQVRWESPPLGHYGYTNPNVVSIDGQDHLAMVASPFDWQGKQSVIPYQGVVGLDLDTGEILWQYKDWQCTVPIPQVVDAGQNRLYIGGGYKVGSALFQVKRNGDRYLTEELYKTNDFATHVHPPIVYQGHFYAQCSDNWGRQDGMTCWTIDGEAKWMTKKDPQFDKGGFILADGMIISVDGKKGVLYLLEATPERFNVLSQAQLLDRSTCWAPLALSRGKLIIRDDKQMKCLLVK